MPLSTEGFFCQKFSMYQISPNDCYLSWITSDVYLGWKSKLTIHIQNTFCITKGLFTLTQDSKLPRGNHCPGLSVTLRSHDDLLSRGNNVIVNWSLWIYLNSFRFYTDCYGEWILNTFTYFWCFLELFIWEFIPNINNEREQDYSCLLATFAFCSHGEKLPWQGRLPGIVQWVTRLSKLPRGKDKFMWTVTDVRPYTESKLTLGSVSCPETTSCPGSMLTGPKSAVPRK